jgi:hypothetical protein
MNNSDMPANPTIYMPTKEGGMWKNNDTAVTKHSGLTKREAFANQARGFCYGSYARFTG